MTRPRRNAPEVDPPVAPPAEDPSGRRLPAAAASADIGVGSGRAPGADRERLPVTTPVVPPAPGAPGLLAHPSAAALRRAHDDRMIAGVAGGVGAWLGVDSILVRLAFILLSTAAGFGVALYVIARVVVPEEPVDPDQRTPPREATAKHAVGLLLVVLGVLVLLRAVGAWLSDGLAWSVGLAVVGSGVVWTRATDAERARWREMSARTIGGGRAPDLASFGRVRLALGVGLVLAGMVTFLLTSNALTVAADLVVALAITVGGAALLIGPYLQRLLGQIAEERRVRIRTQERADMAAHLHDSVLQTLALIQRADDPDEMARLARGQERELRAWLFGRRPDAAAARLGEAVEDMAARVEERVGGRVTIEVVLAGDRDLDDAHRHDLLALVEAAGEAMTNAAKHAGVTRVDVFVEVEPSTVSIFVRDEGVGFEPSDVDADRRGVAESIRGRMARHGGDAIITTAPGEGTEVELCLPVHTEPQPGGETA